MGAPQWALKWRDPIVILTALTLIVLIVQAVILWRQANLQGMSINLARNDQRAWIAAVNPSGAVGIGTPTDVRIILRNCGQGPALRMRHNIHLRYQSPPEPFDPGGFPGATGLPSTGPLAPGQETTAPVPKDMTLTPDLVNALREGKARLYLSGEVDYDTLGESHRTTFRFYADQSLSGWVTDSSGNNMD